MEKIKNYKELIAYQKAFELVKRLYAVTKSFPREELYGIVSQMRRAVVSIPSNIAEGYMRGTKEYSHFLRIALGSAAEIETLLLLSRDLSLLSKNAFEEIFYLNEEVIKLLRSYLKKM